MYDIINPLHEQLFAAHSGITCAKGGAPEGLFNLVCSFYRDASDNILFRASPATFGEPIGVLQTGTVVKVLVCGAGVQGRFLAATMHRAGIDVTLLARGDRLRDIQFHGVRFAIHPSTEVISVPVPVTSDITAAGQSDSVFVVMQKQQAIDLTPALAASRSESSVVCCIGNNGTCVADYGERIPEEYILLGFLGMGGHRLGDHMRLLVQTPTTIMLGTPSGKETPQLGLVEQVLTNAGLKVDVTPSIDAWLKCHLATILPLAGGIYAAGTDNYRLTRTPGLMRVVARAIKESLHVIAQLGYPLLPKQLSKITSVPALLLVWIFGKRFASVEAEIGVAGHAKAARAEIQHLSEEFQLLVDRSRVATPNLAYLIRFLDPDVPTISEGVKHIKIE